MNPPVPLLLLLPSTANVVFFFSLSTAGFSLSPFTPAPSSFFSLSYFLAARWSLLEMWLHNKVVRENAIPQVQANHAGRLCAVHGRRRIA